MFLLGNGLLIVLLAVFVNSFQAVEEAFIPPFDSYPCYYEYQSATKEFQKNYMKLPPNAPAADPEFRTKRPNIPFKTFSQSGQELIVLNILRDLSNGYFVDLAANDWKRLSNTLALEYYNRWDGVCIEPNRIYFSDILQNRRCILFTNPVTDQSGDTVTFNIRNQMSGIVGDEFDNKYNASEMIVRADYMQNMTTTTLAQILDFIKAPSIIHYLSLDIEGAEFLALRGFDFSRYVFMLITVERPKRALHHLLVKRGYVFMYLVSAFGECLYAHNSLENLEEMMVKYKRGQVFIWNNEDHEYLKYPKWSGNYSTYRYSHDRISKIN